jgi:hypothetical protein
VHVAKRRCHSLDCEIVRAFRVDFDFVAAIGGLVEVDVGALRGAFGDRLVGSVVSVLRVLFLRVDLEIVGAASVLEN